jgi:hypothetical protein
MSVTAAYTSPIGAAMVVVADPVTVGASVIGSVWRTIVLTR